MIKIRVTDLETCGLEASDGVVECGFTDIVGDDKGWSIADAGHHSFFVDPERPIPPESRAVHHIGPADVAGSPPWEKAQSLLHAHTGDAPMFYAAHRVAFESMFITLPPDARWICTWKCAVTLAPNAPGWSNNTLRYWLNLDVDPVLAAPPHRAGPDSYVTAHLLKRMLVKTTPQMLADISAAPVILPRLSFGKHAKQPCEEVPDGYWRWVLNQQDFDEDVRATAFHWLNKDRA